MHLYKPKNAFQPKKKKSGFEQSTKRRLTDFYPAETSISTSSSKGDTKKEKLRAILIKSLREQAKAKR